MIRPLTIITMLLAAGSGAYLFAVKHHAQMLDDQIDHVLDNSRQDVSRIRVLQAQWAQETDPNRLQLLATQFTGLQPMQPAQLVTLAALKTSLPAPGSTPPTSNPELPGQAPAELIASIASPGMDGSVADAAGGLPMPPPPPGSNPVAPAMVASAVAPAAVARQAAPAGLASAMPAPRSFARPARRVNHSALGEPQFAAAVPQHVYSAPHVFAQPAMPAERNMPMGAQVMSVKASATMPQYSPPASPDNSGSALGMGSDLPPPQPLPQGGD